MVGSYLVDQRLCSRNIERKEGTTRSCINVVLGFMVQAMVEVLIDQPLFDAVMWVSLYVLLEMLPDFQDGLIRQLLDSDNPIPEGIGLAHWKVLG